MPSTITPRKRRLLIAAAIFILPLAGIVFALFNIVHQHQQLTVKPAGGSAFNTQLPAPNVAQAEKNKLQLYMQAQDDSIKKSQESAKDPYQPGSPSSPLQPALPTPPPALKPPMSESQKVGVVTSPFANDNEKNVTERLEKIYSALSHGATTSPESGHNASTLMPAFAQPDPMTPGAARMERLMQAFQKSDTAPNPQLAQVKQVLDEIREIQHPSDVGASPKYRGPASAPLSVFSQPAVSVDAENTSPVGQAIQNGFFGLEDDSGSSAVVADTRIEAVINADQVVQTGSVVKFRLLQPIYLGNTEIPANSFVHGPATITGERVTVALTDIACNGHIYPIAMDVYDASDGLEGLYVPGMITRDVVKQGMAQGIGGMTVGTFDQSVGAQAAVAAIETTRNLLSRKVALVKATLKAGHVVILKSTSNAK